MLIVPHALQCVDGCFLLYFTVFDILLLANCIQIKILWQNSLTRELNIKVVGFVLKKILMYFEMLIVPYALHCVDSCIFVFTSFDTVCCFGFSAAPLTPFPNVLFIRFSFFVKIHLLESS